MNNIVTVNLPKNLSEEDSGLFTPFVRYGLESLAVGRHKDVFVTHNGFCIDKKGLMKESHHGYPDQYPSYLRIAADHQYDVYLHPDNLIHLDPKKSYVVIHHPFLNYYHWVCESIFRAWMVRDMMSDLVLVLPEEYKSFDFIMNSIRPFGFRDIFFIPGRKSIQVPDLVLPPIKPIVDGYYQKEVEGIKAFYLDYVRSLEGQKCDFGERLYISRRKAARKKVENEDEIEPIIKKYGFEIVSNEEFSFLDQISYFSKAKYVISIHGSGLTNILFMKPGSSVLEFQKKKTNSKDWHSHAFWYLADCLGFDYYHQLCVPTDTEHDYFTANIIVDPVKLEENIVAMLSK